LLTDRRHPAHDESRHSGCGRRTLPQANLVDRGRLLRQPRDLVLQSRSLLDRGSERGYQRLGFLGREFGCCASLSRQVLALTDRSSPGLLRPPRSHQPSLVKDRLVPVQERRRRGGEAGAAQQARVRAPLLLLLAYP
jgi:hypothetical protein